MLRGSMELGGVGVDSGCFAAVLPATHGVERAGQNEVSSCFWDHRVDPLDAVIGARPAHQDTFGNHGTAALREAVAATKKMGIGTKKSQ
jgi:hypothetical protein